MEVESWPITWCRRLVGWIASPRVDMPHYYGRWVAVDGPVAIEFLAALRRAVDEDAGLEVVVSDNLPGIAYCHPDDYSGEIDIRWDWSGYAEQRTAPETDRKASLG